MKRVRNAFLFHVTAILRTPIFFRTVGLKFMTRSWWHLSMVYSNCSSSWWFLEILSCAWLVVFPKLQKPKIVKTLDPEYQEGGFFLLKGFFENASILCLFFFGDATTVKSYYLNKVYVEINCSESIEWKALKIIKMVMNYLVIRRHPVRRVSNIRFLNPWNYRSWLHCF